MTAWTYNVQDLPTRILHGRRTPAGSAAVAMLDYVYSAGGKVQQETEQGVPGGGERLFEYNSLGELWRETGPELGPNGSPRTTQYFYDLNGNRTKVVRPTGTEYAAYDAADRLTAVSGAAGLAPSGSNPGASYQYDDFGQLTQRARWSRSNSTPQVQFFQWNADGRLTEVRQGGNTGSDPLMRATYTGDGERLTHWDRATGQQRLSSFGLAEDVTYGSEHANGPADVTARIHTPGLAQRTVQRGGTATDRVYHEDWLGSTRYLSDGNGQYPSVGRFDAYGQRTALAGTDGADVTAYQYAGAYGYEREPAATGLGLDYLYQRYYDPAAGRFISRDPIRWAGGLNLYAYVENDPVNGVDPDGLQRRYYPRYGEEGEDLDNPSLNQQGSDWMSRAWSRQAALARDQARMRFNHGSTMPSGRTVRDVIAQSKIQGPYSGLKDSRSVAAGKEFTTAAKQKAYEANRARNGGVLCSDLSGKAGVPSSKSTSGVTPPKNEVQLDHYFPKDLGGSNSFKNARVLLRTENRTKTNSNPYSFQPRTPAEPFKPPYRHEEE